MYWHPPKKRKKVLNAVTEWKESFRINKRRSSAFAASLNPSWHLSFAHLFIPRIVCVSDCVTPHCRALPLSILKTLLFLLIFLFVLQGRLLNLSCSTVPTFVLSITATTQVSDSFTPSNGCFYRFVFAFWYSKEDVWCNTACVCRLWPWSSCTTPRKAAINRMYTFCPRRWVRIIFFSPVPYFLHYKNHDFFSQLWTTWLAWSIFFARQGALLHNCKNLIDLKLKNSHCATLEKRYRNHITYL